VTRGLTHASRQTATPSRTKTVDPPVRLVPYGSGFTHPGRPAAWTTRVLCRRHRSRFFIAAICPLADICQVPSGGGASRSRQTGPQAPARARRGVTQPNRVSVFQYPSQRERKHG
jgi:hypothetical protein